MLRRGEVLGRLADVLAGLARGSLGAREIASRLRALAGELERYAAQAGTTAAPARPAAPTAPPAEEPEAAPKHEHEEAAKRIFLFWARTMGKPKARLTPERRQKVLARLRDGYTEAQIRAAIRGCAGSGHHRGENDTGTSYDDLTLICRNGSKLEWFAGLRGAERSGEPEQAGTDAGAAREEEIARLERTAEQALADSDTKRYEEANARLATLLGRGDAQKGKAP
jgi:hypothetical protein